MHGFRFCVIRRGVQCEVSQKSAVLRGAKEDRDSKRRHKLVGVGSSP